MRYGFVIDHGSCIGCHACSLACKSEHDVPLGSYRTWVKYVEKGTFPDVRRYFTVLRCNHCDDAPCIDICPVTALFDREDGIVDFDRDVCIGCKACMQACPYDALYIHPERGTAEKCNFCAHRVDRGLEPPCATVCPTEAILVGDLDDPASRVSRVTATRQAAVRKPEKGTRPKVYYLEGEPRALTPGAADASGGWLWADRADATPMDEALAGSPPPPMAAPARPGLDAGWPGSAHARTVYDVRHEPAPWGARVSAYLWTKSLAAGAFVVAALAGLLGVGGNDAVTVGAPTLGLLMLALTGGLLVADLKRPERFWTILTRPNWSSWLARGAFVITAFGLAGTAWATLAFLAIFTEILPPALQADLATGGGSGGTALVQGLQLLVVALGLATAGYSGYLFAQAKGRDFWQSPLLPAHLSIQAVVAGVAACLPLAWWGDSAIDPLARVLATTTALHVALIFVGEVTVAHATEHGARAAREMTRGRWARWFWSGVVLSAAAAVAGVVFHDPGGWTVAAVAAAALAGLAAYEHAWNLSGQAVPLS